MQLFVGEPYFLVTGHAVDLRVVDYIKSIELAGKFYSQIETRLEQGQLHHLPGLRRHRAS